MVVSQKSSLHWGVGDKIWTGISCGLFMSDVVFYLDKKCVYRMKHKLEERKKDVSIYRYTESWQLSKMRKSSMMGMD